MKPYPFVVTDSNFASLTERSPWPQRRLLTLEDEVGRLCPGKLPYIQPPVKYSEVSQAEKLEEDAGGGHMGRGMGLYLLTLALVGLAMVLGYYAPEIGRFFLSL